MTMGSMIEERFILSLEKARKAIQMADHLSYITFPLIKENKLLLKILEELNIAIISMVNAVLQYEYLNKRIEIYNNAKDNFETFKNIAFRYSINDEQVRKIIEIINLAEKHKKSPFEFSKNDKIVIMSENMYPDILTLEKIKSYLLEAKDILRKIGIAIRKV